MLLHCILFLLTWVQVGDAGEISLSLLDAKNPIKHLYLDFDHTITEDGFSGVLRGIVCGHQKYPNCTCTPKANKQCTDTDETTKKAMVTALHNLPNKGTGNLTKSFGGADRLSVMKSFIKDIRKTLNGNVFIVSTSWFPVSKLQWQTYLLEVSSMLDLGFDADHVITLNDPGPGLSADKGAEIKANMAKTGIKFAEAVFADDTGGNIKKAKDVTNTIYLPRKMGLDQTDRDYIKVLAKGSCDWNSAAASVRFTGMGVMVSAALLVISILYA